MIINIAHTKGGVGKSTLATNLAVELNCPILDLDKQGSSKYFNELRVENKKTPLTVILAQSRNDLAILQEYSESPKKHIIIDSGGMDNDLIRCGIELSDIIITPVRPSKIEVKGLQEFVQMVNQSSFNAKNHYILLNNVQSRSIKDVEDMTDSIKGAKLNLLHTRIGLRKLFMDAYAEGKSVIELNKSSLAADELRVLVKELKDIIKRKV